MIPEVGDLAGGRRKSPAEIEAEIQQQREAISQDIRALGDKLSPERIKEEAKEALHDMKESAVDSLRSTKNQAVDSLRTAKERAVDSMSETAGQIRYRARRAGAATSGFVTSNAVPLAVIGLGMGWLALSMRRASNGDGGSSRYRRPPGYEGEQRRSFVGGVAPYYDYEDESDLDDAFYSRGRFEHGGDGHEDLDFQSDERGGGVLDRGEDLLQRGRERGEALLEHGRERAEALRERAADRMGRARERAREGAYDLRQRVGALSHETRARLGRAQRRSRAYAHDNPLALSAVLIALGIGAGMLLPSTPKVQRIIGEPGRRLVGEAREVVDEARQAAERVGRVAKDTAGELKNAVSSGQSSNKQQPLSLARRVANAARPRSSPPPPPSCHRDTC